MLAVVAIAGAADVQAAGWVVAIGGGAESDAAGAWSERPYRFVVDHAGGRPIVIVSAVDESEWLPDYFRQLGAVDAVNLKIDSRATADSPATAALIDGAGAVFLKGGNQWDYVRFFAGTKTESSIRAVFDRGGVVAGTSAGAHVLGSVVYDAREGSVYPEEAIRDPWNRYITFTTGFLDVLPNVLVDTHFTSRGRLARLVPMVARADAGVSQGAGKRGAVAADRLDVVTTLGIGIDDQTALMIAPDGTAEVAGEGAVTFVHATGTTGARTVAGKAPVLTNVAYDQLTEGFVFDLARRRVVVVPSAAEPVIVEPATPRYSSLRLDGGSGESGRTGVATLANAATDPRALLYGALREEPGRGLVPSFVIVTQALVDPDFFENRVGGLQWLLARHPGCVGILLDRGGTALIDERGRLRPDSAASEPSMILIDTRGMQYRASSRWRISELSVGPRQSVALVGCRIHLIASGWSLDLATGRVTGALAQVTAVP